MFDPSTLKFSKKAGVIPVLYKRLDEIAQQIRGGACPTWPDLADELAWISANMHRREPARKAPPQRATARKGLKGIVVAFAAAHPEMDEQAIGEHFNLAGGRVSEYVHGYAFERR